jgi:hypothetical protein
LAFGFWPFWYDFKWRTAKDQKPKKKTVLDGDVYFITSPTIALNALS